MAGCDARQKFAQNGKFAPENCIEDPSFGLEQERLKVWRSARRLSPYLVERCKAVTIDEQVRDYVQHLVSGRAMNSGEAWQALAFAENLFDQQVEWLCGLAM